MFPGESHYYQFHVDNLSTVNFDACLSDANIAISIWKDLEEDAISYTYCTYGDGGCGYCTIQNNLFAQNLTMPQMIPGTYFIRVKSALYDCIGSAEAYQLDISCSPYSDELRVSNIDSPLKCGDTITGELRYHYDID